jgi:hypothetical protein
MNKPLIGLTLVLVAAASAALAQDDVSEPPTRLELAADTTIEAAPQPAPLTLSRRYLWAAKSSISPARLAGYAVTSGLYTWTDSPKEYGPHWEGFGKRMGMRLANGATGTMMEASVGALWGEDPRYVRATGQPLGKRLGHVVKMTFIARNRSGDSMPAYARYISVPANSFMSNAWRPDSEADARHAAMRIPMAFLNRAIGNAFAEFWPDAAKWLHRNQD